MKLDNEERREVAARLRELADVNEGCLGMDRVNRVLRDGQAILGTSGLASVADVLRRHADLIEPEPERTCKAEQIPYMSGCYKGCYCKDCKFFGKDEACVMFPMQTIRMIHPSKDGFCAWGKKTDD